MATAPNLRGAKDEDAASEAARLLGSIKTERKIETARANLAKAKQEGRGGRPPMKDPLTLACICGAGTETEIGTGHKTTCPRGRLLYQRAKVQAAKLAKGKA